MTDEEMLALRDVAESFMVDNVCTIFRKTGDVVSKGIPKPTYDSGTETPCDFVASDTTAEIVQNGKTVNVAKASFIFPATTVLSEEDYIAFSGKTYNIFDAPAVGRLDATLTVSVRRRS